MKPNQKRIDKGLWWDRTWTLTRGCCHVSPGCDHCWAEDMSNMRKNNGAVADMYGMTDDKGKWTGKAEPLYQNLQKPLHVRKPKVWTIWNDLFHKDVPDDFIDKVFAVMALSPQHTFMVLTKRPERMREWFGNIGGTQRSDWVFSAIGKILNVSRCKYPEFPLPNLMLGVTAENQEQADKRIPVLLQIPAAVRFVGVEPMLGPVILQNLYGPEPRYLGGYICTECEDEPPGYECNCCEMKTDVLKISNGLDFVIAGGESGRHARPAHPDWFKQVRDQCQAAGVPFFFKQWGEWAEFTANGSLPINCNYVGIDGDIRPGDWLWDTDVCMGKVGKKKAGRLLEGREWSEWPK